MNRAILVSLASLAMACSSAEGFSTSEEEQTTAAVHGFPHAVMLVDQYPGGGCNTDPHASLISANEGCSNQLAQMRAGAMPGAKIVAYMKGPICSGITPCSGFAESDYAHTSAGTKPANRIHPQFGYPNQNFIMSPKSSAWRAAAVATCKRMLSEGFDGCFADLEGPQSWDGCANDGQSTCTRVHPDGNAATPYAWSQELADMQQALTSALPSALWESNGIGSAAAFTASSPAFDSSRAPSVTNFGSLAEAFTSAQFEDDMTMLASKSAVFVIGKGDHMDDLAAFLLGARYAASGEWPDAFVWCPPSSLDECARADTWLVAFDANVNGKGGARFTNAAGLVERDFGTLATSKVVFNDTTHSITYKPPVGSHTPDGAKAPASITLAPNNGYVTF
jgi:hypothetical protein